jgi:pSer/pThr/pTyr-binding forkhead associated (FHA) protein
METAKNEPGSQSAYFQSGSETFHITVSELVIGRQEPATLVFNYQQVSRQHLKVTKVSKGYLAQDLESRFGTFVNGHTLGIEPIRLQDGDELVLAGVLSLRFFDPAQTQGGKRVGRLKGLWIDPESHEVWLDGQQLSPPLSAAQLTLLKLLEKRSRSFVTREEVVEAVWPDASIDGVSEEAVDGLIKRTRARLREAGSDAIEVRRGIGLRLKPDSEA